MRIDGGRSYQRWYKARRALGLPTHGPWLTAEQIKTRNRDYMREYMRDYRKRKKGAA